LLQMQKEYLKMHSHVKKNIAPLIVICIGSLSWILTMFKSGLMYPFGIGFWGPHGHDGVWHIALAESLLRGSFEMPTFSGVQLQNYHIGFDLLIALLSKISTIPISVIYFQILPILFSIAVGTLSYKFVLEWKKDTRAALWSTFFVYFGGSLGWLVTLYRTNELGGESIFWSQQGISSLINPPFALSLIVMLGGLLLLHKNKILMAVLFFSLLLSIKSYAGVLIIGALTITSIYEYIKNKNTQLAKISLTVTVVSIMLFLPLNSKAGGLLLFQPFWFLETMLAISDRFYWPRLYEAILNWRSGALYYKAIIGYSVALALFVIGNLWTRLVALVILPKTIMSIKKLDRYTIVLWIVALGGIAFPLLFVQKGTPWNTIQFLYYTLFVLSLLAGPSLAEVSRRLSTSKARLLTFFIILLTIPTSVGTLSFNYLPNRPPAQLPKLENEALHALASEPHGVVLTFPFDGHKAAEAASNPPRPLALYESTAYVSAFSKKPVFLEDEVNLTILNYDWKSRRESIDKFYQSKNESEVRTFLKDNKIKYIYWRKGQRAVLGETQLGIERIFENKEIDIYRVIAP